MLKAFNIVVESEPLSHGREERMDVAASATGWGGQENDTALAVECGRTVQDSAVWHTKSISKGFVKRNPNASRWPPARLIILVAGA